MTPSIPWHDTTTHPSPDHSQHDQGGGATRWLLATLRE